MKITLDPGHGRLSNRGVDPTYYEGTRMFLLAGFLKEELEKYEDVTVNVTRKTLDDDPSLEKRGRMARDLGSELFISLHSNAAGSEKACGVSLYRSVKLEGSEKLAHLLADGAVSVINEKTGVTYKRGVKTRTYDENGKTYDYYGVIRNSVGGSVKYSYIIEHGFHTNERECAFLQSDENLKSLARKHAETIAEYFSLKKRKEEEKYTEYTVRTGDTLIKIAKRYGTDYRSLAKYNGIQDPDRIYTGQIVKIPSEQSDGKIIRNGDTVRLKDSAKTYYPGGKSFKSWVREYDFKVARTVDSKGRDVFKGGEKCVLLGEKINRKTKKTAPSINTWCSIENLDKIN